jgi:hypothetical protein
MDYYDKKAAATKFMQDLYGANEGVNINKDKLYLVMQTKYGFGKKFVDKTIELIKG